MNVHVFPGRLDENVDDGSGIRPIFPKEVHTVLNVEVGDSASYDSLEILCVNFFEKKTRYSNIRSSSSVHTSMIYMSAQRWFTQWFQR